MLRLIMLDLESPQENHKVHTTWIVEIKKFTSSGRLAGYGITFACSTKDPYYFFNTSEVEQKYIGSLKEGDRVEVRVLVRGTYTKIEGIVVPQAFRDMLMKQRLALES